MPTFTRVTDLQEFETPWGKFVRFQEIVLADGTVMLRLRIREGRRFTDLELTPEIAQKLGLVLTDWAAGGAGMADSAG